MRRVGNQTAQSASIQAPVGGLNDRDSLAAMPPKDAVILRNWWPEPSRLVTRKGSQDWATGFPSEVRTLVQYANLDGTYEIFAASGSNVYNVTDSGPVGAPVLSGLTLDIFEPTSISTAGGNFLYLFNGQDEARLYDGTTWTVINGASTPAITGVATDTIKSAIVFKSRLFLVERNSMTVFYLPPASIAGAAAMIDLGSVFQRDGYIVGLYSWTIDAGDGADDHLVVLSSNGEAAIYSGTDPSNIATWNLVGLFFVGKPVGSRPMVKFGGDLMYLCERGLVPLSAALLSSAIDRKAAISDKVQNGMSSAMRDFGLNFGWEVKLHPQQNALIVNVPAGYGRNYQYLQNLITQAWTIFDGWDARTFLDSGFGLFFGDSNSVKIAWVGENDGMLPIECDALQSFQDFKSPAITKYFTMAKPYLRSNGNPSILFGLNGDYNVQNISGTFSYNPPYGMVWGSMVWGTMTWGGSLRNITGWQTYGSVFTSAAMRLKLQNNGSSTEWANTDYVYQRGGLL